MYTYLYGYISQRKYPVQTKYVSAPILFTDDCVLNYHARDLEACQSKNFWPSYREQILGPSQAITLLF